MSGEGLNLRPKTRRVDRERNLHGRKTDPCGQDCADQNKGEGCKETQSHNRDKRFETQFSGWTWKEGERVRRAKAIERVLHSKVPRLTTTSNARRRREIDGLGKMEKEVYRQFNK